MRNPEDTIQVHEVNYVQWSCPAITGAGWTTAFDRYEEPPDEWFEYWVLEEVEGEEVQPED